MAFQYQFEKKKDLDVMVTEQNSLLVFVAFHRFCTRFSKDVVIMWLH